MSVQRKPKEFGRFEWQFCPKCMRKGFYKPTPIVTKNGRLITFNSTCKFCHFEPDEVTILMKNKEKKVSGFKNDIQAQLQHRRQT